MTVDKDNYLFVKFVNNKLYLIDVQIMVGTRHTLLIDTAADSGPPSSLLQPTQTSGSTVHPGITPHPTSIPVTDNMLLLFVKKYYLLLVWDIQNRPFLIHSVWNIPI